jgi:hypothetical protein
LNEDLEKVFITQQEVEVAMNGSFCNEDDYIKLFEKESGRKNGVGERDKEKEVCLIIIVKCIE